jgi:hypothetical protein
MKKLVGLFGLLASLAFCSMALAAGLIVHSGETVTLPCNVPGTVIVESGGTVITDASCGSTTIQGSLDIHPGGTAQLCNTRVNGSLIARQVGAGSYFAGGSVGGANRNDGSLTTSPVCG